jgi:hypothetical protein
VDALCTGVRTIVEGGVFKLELDVDFYGAPLVADDVRRSFVRIPIVSGESFNVTSGKINTAVLAEAARMELSVPADVRIPAYVKTK